MDGMMIQLPLPSTRLHRHLHAIRPNKDADGLSLLSMGRLAYYASKLSTSAQLPSFEELALASSLSTTQQQQPADEGDLLGMFHEIQPTIPAAAGGLFDLIHHYGVHLKGKNVLVVGSSPLLGLPTSLLCLAHQATVTTAHAASVDLISMAKQADIVITAVGHPSLLTGRHLKPGSIVLDAGCSFIPGQSHPVGDIEFESAIEVCSKITPVPGGVGPCTIARLLSNVTMLWKRRHNL